MTIVAGTVCMFLHWYFGVLKLSGTSDVQEMQLGAAMPSKGLLFLWSDQSSLAKG